MRKTLVQLRDGIRLCRGISPQIRASQLDIILSIALKPGCTQTELAIETEMSPAAISRAVDVLGKSGRRDKRSCGRRDKRSGGLGLIEACKSPNDERSLQVYLTPAGEQFVSLLRGTTHE